MSFTRQLGGGVALLGGAAALLGTAFSGVHPEGPPPGHTGGFGEPTCHACHFDTPPDPEEGDLAIRPLGPAGGAAPTSDTAIGASAPADLCVLEVRLRSPDIRSAGFQLSARHATGEEQGEQAGELVALDDRVQVVTDPGTGIQYAGQTAVGAEVASGAGSPEVDWRVGWRPPEDAPGSCSDADGASADEGGTHGSTAPAEDPGSAGGPSGGPAVLLHAAANAGNDDASPFGDRVYTTELAWPPKDADGAEDAGDAEGADGRRAAAGAARAGPDSPAGARGPARASDRLR